jgi:hypothetical protein
MKDDPHTPRSPCRGWEDAFCMFFLALCTKVEMCAITRSIQQKSPFLDYIIFEATLDLPAWALCICRRVPRKDKPSIAISHCWERLSDQSFSLSLSLSLSPSLSLSLFLLSLSRPLSLSLSFFSLSLALSISLLSLSLSPSLSFGRFFRTDAQKAALARLDQIENGRGDNEQKMTFFRGETTFMEIV